eukprot:GHVU01141905.1.p2 GENE.GHVU01141905.1~~GHVU01141905.1.p2  ORF type:complete len:149 (-),score=9.49 GHVU01141905.1:170-616(-)
MCVCCEVTHTVGVLPCILRIPEFDNYTVYEGEFQFVTEGEFNFNGLGAAWPLETALQQWQYAGQFENSLPQGFGVEWNVIPAIGDPADGNVLRAGWFGPTPERLLTEKAPGKGSGKPPKVKLPKFKLPKVFGKGTGIHASTIVRNNPA